MEDTAPGEVAEADFGRLGMIRRRAVGGLIIVLVYSALNHNTVADPSAESTLDLRLLGSLYQGCLSICCCPAMHGRWRHKG